MFGLAALIIKKKKSYLGYEIRARRLLLVKCNGLLSHSLTKKNSTRLKCFHDQNTGHTKSGNIQKLDLFVSGFPNVKIIKNIGNIPSEH